MGFMGPCEHSRRGRRCTCTRAHPQTKAGRPPVEFGRSAETAVVLLVPRGGWINHPLPLAATVVPLLSVTVCASRHPAALALLRKGERHVVCPPCFDIRTAHGQVDEVLRNVSLLGCAVDRYGTVRRVDLGFADVDVRGGQLGGIWCWRCGCYFCRRRRRWWWWWWWLWW